MAITNYTDFVNNYLVKNGMIGNADNMNKAPDQLKKEIDEINAAKVDLTTAQTIGGIKTFSSTIVGSVSGNAGTATKLAAAKTINGVGFDGSANINVNTVASEVIKFDSGTTEGTDLYTFNGSTAKTIDIKAGTNVTLTKTAGSVTISANDTSVNWSEIQSKPTTLSGYGITDSVAKVSSTDNAIVRFNGTTGDVQNSNVILDDNGGLGIGGYPGVYTGYRTLTIRGTDASHGGVIELTNSDASCSAYAITTSDRLSIATNTNHPIVFSTNNTEKMRIDSAGNVGIGISSPAGKLSVMDTNGGMFIDGTNATYNRLKSHTSNTGTDKDLLIATSSTGTSGIYINTSGNVGIGVAPSAWNGGNKAIQLGYSGGVYAHTSSEQMAVFSNAYRTSAGGYVYQNNGYATIAEQVNGMHQWYTAPSGTAGNAITWNQAMTLDASGLNVYGNTLALHSDTFPVKNVVKFIDLGLSGITGAMNYAIRGVYQNGSGVGNEPDGGNLDLIKSLDRKTILATDKDGNSLTSVLIGTTTNNGVDKLQVNGSISGTSFNSITGLSSTTPLMNGTAAVGTGVTTARADHVHPSDTTKANLASPAFTGSPTAPTPTGGDSSTKLATTAFATGQDIGVGQTWQDMTASRAYGVTYTNNTGKPIAFSITTGAGNGIVSLDVNSIIVGYSMNANGILAAGEVIVPNGSTYRANIINGTPNVIWKELR